MAQAINEITVKISQCELFGNNKKNLMKRGKKYVKCKIRVPHDKTSNTHA